MPIITLTTDYGTQDGFVAQMQGVILGLSPESRLVNVTHEINPFAVMQAALVLKGISRYFPPGTIHCAVVDPGVGSDRRNIALRTGNQIFVGPDNGLFSLLLTEEIPWEAREIQNSEYIMPDPHPTFHGRDVFAPVAAHLSLGKAFESVGNMIQDPVRLPVSSPRISKEGVEGQVIHIDRFGNLTTNIDSRMLPNSIKTISIAHWTISRMSKYFNEVQAGEPVALMNSFGFLEIAVNRGNAAQDLGIGKGTRVSVQFAG
jgi:S-adenosylmethionine hydrolase